MSDIPTIEQELSRKSGEALLWLDNEQARGSISEREVVTALTLFDLTTLGLTDKEYSDWSSERRAESRKQHGDTVVFHNQSLNLVMIAELDRIQGRVRFIQHGKKLVIGEWRGFEDETDQIRAAVDYYYASLLKIQAKGWGII